MAGITQPGALNSSTTPANTSQSLSQPQPQTTIPSRTLPPPQTFDILSPLHELLARIEHVSTQGDILPTSEDGNGEGIGTRYQNQPPLEPKDLPGEILPLKAKIRKVLRELEKLPDMDRSVEEQREEIAELEERRRRQLEMIGKLAGVAEGLNGRLGKVG